SDRMDRICRMISCEARDAIMTPSILPQSIRLSCLRNAVGETFPFLTKTVRAASFLLFDPVHPVNPVQKARFEDGFSIPILSQTD
ncbi:MAG: hypothetical protein WBL39_24445, partial [Terrimicrobiaceae bacterium]